MCQKFSAPVSQKSPCYRSLFVVQILKTNGFTWQEIKSAGGRAHTYTNAFLWLLKVLHQVKKTRMTHNSKGVTTQHIQSLAPLTDACTCTHTKVRQVNRQKKRTRSNLFRYGRSYLRCTWGRTVNWSWLRFLNFLGAATKHTYKQHILSHTSTKPKCYCGSW